jgi:general secretion pathway protein K
VNRYPTKHEPTRHCGLYAGKSTAKIRGIALVQILIICAILSLVALYITQSARQQVQMAQWALDKSQATVNLHSARNRVMFRLLTSTWQSDGVNISDSEQWNLYSQPIQLADNVTMQLQDQAGLINLHYPQGGGVIEQVLLYQGLASDKALKAQAVLFDWQDSDEITTNNGDETNSQQRDGAMADIREWLLHKTIEAHTLSAIQANFSLYGASYLNLMTSPEYLLAALTDDATARELVTLRAQEQLTAREITQAVNQSQQMDIFLTPGNNIALTLDVRFGEARVRQKTMINFNPYVVNNKSPVNILQSSGG